MKFYLLWDYPRDKSENQTEREGKRMEDNLGDDFYFFYFAGERKQSWMLDVREWFFLCILYFLHCCSWNINTAEWIVNQARYLFYAPLFLVLFFFSSHVPSFLYISCPSPPWHSAASFSTYTLSALHLFDLFLSPLFFSSVIKVSDMQFFFCVFT